MSRPNTPSQGEWQPEMEGGDQDTIQAEAEDAVPADPPTEEPPNAEENVLDCNEPPGEEQVAEEPPCDSEPPPPEECPPDIQDNAPEDCPPPEESAEDRAPEECEPECPPPDASDAEPPVEECDEPAAEEAAPEEPCDNQEAEQSPSTDMPDEEQPIEEENTPEECPPTEDPLSTEQEPIEEGDQEEENVPEECPPAETSEGDQPVDAPPPDETEPPPQDGETAASPGEECPPPQDDIPTQETDAPEIPPEGNAPSTLDPSGANVDDPNNATDGTVSDTPPPPDDSSAFPVPIGDNQAPDEPSPEGDQPHPTIAGDDPGSQAPFTDIDPIAGLAPEEPAQEEDLQEGYHDTGNNRVLAARADLLAPTEHEPANETKAAQRVDQQEGAENLPPPATAPTVQIQLGTFHPPMIYEHEGSPPEEESEPPIENISEPAQQGQPEIPEQRRPTNTSPPARPTTSRPANNRASGSGTASPRKESAPSSSVRTTQGGSGTGSRQGSSSSPTTAKRPQVQTSPATPARQPVSPKPKQSASSSSSTSPRTTQGRVSFSAVPGTSVGLGAGKPLPIPEHTSMASTSTPPVGPNTVTARKPIASTSSTKPQETRVRATQQSGKPLPTVSSSSSPTSGAQDVRSSNLQSSAKPPPAASSSSPKQVSPPASVTSLQSTNQGLGREARRASSAQVLQGAPPLVASDYADPAMETFPTYTTHDRLRSSPEPRRATLENNSNNNARPKSFVVTQGAEHPPRGRGISWAEQQHQQQSSMVAGAGGAGTFAGVTLTDPASPAPPSVPPKPENIIPRPISHLDPRTAPLNGTLGRVSTYSSNTSGDQGLNGYYNHGEKLPRKRTAGERLEPTLETAKIEKDKYMSKARWTGIVLNVAIGLQVLLGSLTTGLSVATSGHHTRIFTAILGGLATLVASYLARSRGSNEPELSIARTKDLEQFIRECEAFKMDFGHELGEEHSDRLQEFRRRFEDLLGNGSGERRMSSASV